MPIQILVIFFSRKKSMIMLFISGIRVVHSEKFPIHAVHRFTSSITAAKWLSAMCFWELFAQALESDILCDRDGEAPVQNIDGSRM